MAKTQGFTCDLEGCGQFESSTDSDAPDGWLTIVISASVPRDPRPGELAREKKLTAKHFCSNRCGAIFCTNRHEADTGKRIIRPPAQRKPRKDKGTGKGKEQTVEV